MPGAGAHPYDDPVGEYGRTAGDTASVATRLTDHGRGFTGDRGLVDRRDPVDHIAVGRDGLARPDQNDVERPQSGGRDGFRACQTRIGP